jgi:hypothetical protein
MQMAWGSDIHSINVIIVIHYDFNLILEIVLAEPNIDINMSNIVV